MELHESVDANTMKWQKLGNNIERKTCCKLFSVLFTASLIYGRIIISLRSTSIIFFSCTFPVVVLIHCKRTQQQPWLCLFYILEISSSIPHIFKHSSLEKYKKDINVFALTNAITSICHFSVYNVVSITIIITLIYYHHLHHHHKLQALGFWPVTASNKLFIKFRRIFGPKRDDNGQWRRLAMRNLVFTIHLIWSR